MRSSKSRSRNKTNRNRSPLGNVVNRVFDSSGPEGKVRGTPQQIIDKYNQLARDAQLGNDRVAAENFQQHAEHYLRMLGEAQKEQDARREQQERENRDRQQQRDRNDRPDRPERSERSERHERDGQPETERETVAEDPRGMGDQPDVIDLGDDSDDIGLVETPESGAAEAKPEAQPQQAPKARKPRAPRKPRKKPSDDAASGEDAPQPTPSDAAE